MRGLLSVALRANRATIFQNPDDRAVFVRGGLVRDHRTRVVDGSGVDLQHYREAPLPGGPLTFVLVARLLRMKGVEDFVEAARAVRARAPGRATRFVLVGPLDPNPSAISREAIDAWVAEGVIEYAGETGDVRPCLRDCHVFVLPSRYGEGVPRTILEAMATGRAVITTDSPGCRETVRDGYNGLLVPTADPEALAHAMLRFVNEPGLAVRMGQSSLEVARARFDVRRVNRQMLGALELA